MAQKNYAQLLKDHLEGNVQEIVNKKYHMLKTSDNFDLYKTDIKACIRSMREDSQVALPKQVMPFPQRRFLKSWISWNGALTILSTASPILTGNIPAM
jgi:hypothetical protein